MVAVGEDDAGSYKRGGIRGGGGGKLRSGFDRLRIWDLHSLAVLT